MTQTIIALVLVAVAALWLGRTLLPFARKKTGSSCCSSGKGSGCCGCSSEKKS